jgi:hypothetical protein
MVTGIFDRKHDPMQETRSCGGVLAASLLAWLLLMPPLSISGAGKTVVDMREPLSRWEVFSTHHTAAECSKHRDELRAQLEKAAPSPPPPASQSGKHPATANTAFATLRERAAVARCIADNDPRLHPPATAHR